MSLGTSIVKLDSVQCQLNNNNASHLIITLVVGSQCAPSLDVFIALMKLANALLHQGNTQVQVTACCNPSTHCLMMAFVTRRHSCSSYASQRQRNSSVGYILTLRMQRLN